MNRFVKCAVPLAILPALLAACGGSDRQPEEQPAGPPPTMSVKETVDSSAVFVGDRVTWTIEATNRGGSATTGTATLVATVPGNLSAVSVSATGANCGPVVSTVTCTIDAGMKAGATAKVVLSGTTTMISTLTSSVTPSGAAANACASAGDCSSSTTVAARPTPPNVTVAASVDTTSTSIGNTINWTLTATNTGGVTTAPITLTDTLPASGIGAVTVTPTGATCNPVSGNTLTCSIPAGLANNGTASVRISAPVTAAGNLVNTVAPGAGASCASASTCTTTTAVAAVAAPNVTVSSSVSATTGAIGAPITWTITATNSGTGATTAPITLTDTLPATGISVPIVTPTGATCNAVSGNTLTCTIPAGLAANGGTAKVVVSTTASAAGSLVNTVAPGVGASCTSAANCTTTTVISAGGTTPVQIAGSCGVMIDADTLKNVFGGSSGSLVTLTGLGTTSASGPNTSVYLAGLSATGDPATFESWPGTTNGPGNGTMVTASDKQFICASQNGSSSTGASSTVKYTSDLTNPTSGSPTSLVGNIQVSKAQTTAGFLMFNLPSLSNFSFEYFRNGSNGYQLDYSTDGTTWKNIVTTSASRSTCTNSVCTEVNLLTASPSGATSFTPPGAINQPVLLRLSNINISGTMIIQKLMIKP
ncbi:DUF11 domain-containing protein [Massilia horti]|uniref:DUF11 domain-containing protein n=1 Tax=Massilia horti TaxID=2562153 RepID=A0A4Y9T172_9BURK|nr:DUF11 domain-containing protein [Massilia horti]TFW31313.1 DUF11 domain-containing protein [Massilia horti]